MIAYKLLKVRKDGSIGPLFINCRQRIPIGEWLRAEFHPRKGYQPRKGWHCTLKPVAPHLTTKGPKWYKVRAAYWNKYKRPESQGGTWVLAQAMMVLEAV